MIQRSSYLFFYFYFKTAAFHTININAIPANMLNQGFHSDDAYHSIDGQQPRCVASFLFAGFPTR